METIGIIGAGNIGRSFAAQAVASGYRVVLANSGNASRLAQIVDNLGPNAVSGDLSEAASQPIVVFAARWIHRAAIFAPFKDWDGRILIDASNAYLTHAPDFIKDDLGGRTSSEIVAELAPGARVVKALNTILADRIADGPTGAGGRRVLFLSGDDANAKLTVAELLKRIGFAPIDVGTLREGGKLHQSGGPLAGINVALLD